MRVITAGLLAITVLTPCVACSPSSPPPPPTLVATTRHAGSWSGSGDATAGDIISSSGRLRFTWTTTGEDAPGTGRFRLTVHSGVSGRPLETLVDHRGAGSGEVRFQDDPRVYIVVIQSANVRWTFSVDEELGVYRDATTDAPGR